MTIRIRASGSGRFGDLTSGLARDIAAGVTAAIGAAAEYNKLRKRQAVFQAGLGIRLGNAIRSKVYPERRASVGAAGVVYPSGEGAEKIFAAFNDGAVIRSKDGWFLAVPQPAAGNARSPGEFEQRTGARLRFVYRDTGPSLLVLDDARLRKSGVAVPSRPTRTGRSRSGRVTVPVFVLVRQVRMPRRLAFRQIDEDTLRQAPLLLDRSLPRS